MKKVSDRLQERMRELGLKQSDLVTSTNISKGALSSYISGNYQPKQANIYKLAEALNVNEAWLMGYDVPKERRTNIDKNIFVSNFNLLMTIAKESYDPNKGKRIQIASDRLVDLQLGKSEPTMNELDIISNTFNVGKDDLMTIDLTQPEGKEILDRALNPKDIFDILKTPSLEDEYEEIRLEKLKAKKKDIIRKITTKLGVLNNEYLYDFYNIICNNKINEENDDYYPLLVKYIIYDDERLVPVDEIEYDELLEKLNKQEEANENIKNTLISLFDDTNK